MSRNRRIEEAASFGAARLTTAPVKNIGKVVLPPTRTPTSSASRLTVREPSSIDVIKPTIKTSIVARPSISTASSVTSIPSKAAAITAAKILNPTVSPSAPSAPPAAFAPSAPLENYTPPSEPEYAPYDGGLPPDEPKTSIAPVTQSVPVSKAEQPKGLWERILSFFGLAKKQSATMSGELSLKDTIESIVRRARSGDQNAMALMALVRDNAKRGQGRAQQSYALLCEYVRNHPVDSNPRIGVDYVALTQAVGAPRLGGVVESPDWGADVFADAVALSHGPTLTNPRIGEMLSRFGHETQSAIEYGIANPNTKKQHPGVQMGKILGHARRLQAVRMQGSPVSKFDPIAGRELGE